MEPSAIDDAYSLLPDNDNFSPSEKYFALRIEDPLTSCQNGSL